MGRGGFVLWWDPGEVAARRQAKACRRRGSFWVGLLWRRLRRLTRLTFSASFTRLPRCRRCEEMHERGAIAGRADALLGHLGAGRKGSWANLEQPRHGLRRPHDIKRLECR